MEIWREGEVEKGKYGQRKRGRNRERERGRGGERRGEGERGEGERKRDILRERKWLRGRREEKEAK